MKTQHGTEKPGLNNGEKSYVRVILHGQSMFTIPSKMMVEILLDLVESRENLSLLRNEINLK